MDNIHRADFIQPDLDNKEPKIMEGNMKTIIPNWDINKMELRLFFEVVGIVSGVASFGILLWIISKTKCS
jgi:hypothetical protein